MSNSKSQGLWWLTFFTSATSTLLFIIGVDIKFYNAFTSPISDYTDNIFKVGQYLTSYDAQAMLSSSVNQLSSLIAGSLTALNIFSAVIAILSWIAFFKVADQTEEIEN